MLSKKNDKIDIFLSFKSAFLSLILTPSILANEVSYLLTYLHSPASLCFPPKTTRRRKTADHHLLYSPTQVCLVCEWKPCQLDCPAKRPKKVEIEERKFSFDHNWLGSWDLGLSSPVPELWAGLNPGGRKENSLFARPGSAPIWRGKIGDFRDWTRA